jgi:hypothetical protein
METLDAVGACYCADGGKDARILQQLWQFLNNILLGEPFPNRLFKINIYRRKYL